MHGEIKRGKRIFKIYSIMKKIILILTIAFVFPSFGLDECEVKELNYLMSVIEYKAKMNEIDKELINEWLCRNQNINCL